MDASGFSAGNGGGGLSAESGLTEGGGSGGGGGGTIGAIALSAAGGGAAGRGWVASVVAGWAARGAASLSTAAADPATSAWAISASSVMKGCASQGVTTAVSRISRLLIGRPYSFRFSLESGRRVAPSSEMPANRPRERDQDKISARIRTSV